VGCCGLISMIVVFRVPHMDPRHHDHEKQPAFSQVIQNRGPRRTPPRSATWGFAPFFDPGG
jgi:hypothetical protein